MGHSVAIVGAGQIGYAAANAFRSNNWLVEIWARSKPDWLFDDVEFVTYDNTKIKPPEADLVIDTIAFDGDDVARYNPEHVGRLIAVSSASVYCDTEGRTLDEAAENGFPDFPEPISEDQSTVAPGPETYSTRKIRMERRAAEMFGDRATILRPCAIHGPRSRHPREWWFVKRLLDRRKRIPLALAGESQFQTTAASMIGDFAVHAATVALGGVYNIADEDSPSVKQIGEAIAFHCNRKVEWVLCEGYPEKTVGRTPWSVPAPFVVDGRKAAGTGFDGADIYFDCSESWSSLLHDPPTDWRTAFPQLAAYPWDMFDYAAEDEVLAGL